MTTVHIENSVRVVPQGLTRLTRLGLLRHHATSQMPN